MNALEDSDGLEAEASDDVEVEEPALRESMRLAADSLPGSLSPLGSRNLECDFPAHTTTMKMARRAGASGNFAPLQGEPSEGIEVLTFILGNEVEVPQTTQGRSCFTKCHVVDYNNLPPLHLNSKSYQKSCRNSFYDTFLRNRNMFSTRESHPHFGPNVQDGLGNALIDRTEKISKLTVGGKSYKLCCPSFDELTVITLNVFENGGDGLPSKLAAIVAATPTPDLVFMQEAPTDELHQLHPPEGYEEVYLKGPSPHDSLALWRKTASPWTYKTTETITTELCHTKREAFMTTFRNDRGKEVKVANVHLCGGRFDEKIHGNHTSGKIKQVKEEVVKKAVKAGAHLIVGDFNSDVQHFLTGSVRQKQAEFLGKYGFDDRRIKIWNTAPFRFLESKAYVRVPINDDTSFYGGTPDAMYYKGTLVRREYREYTLLTMGLNGVDSRAGASDHNGIRAKFMV